MIGPSAIGKTMAARRWAAKYPMLTSCLCDVKRVVVNGVEKEEEVTWKNHREQMVQKYRQWPGVVLVESMSGYGIRIGKEMVADHWIVLTCSPEASLQQRKLRCERLNKPFKSSVWDRSTVEYECRRRMLNFARTLSPSQYTHFEINDYVRD